MVTEDEPVKAGGLVVSYATGSEALLSKEVSAGIIPTAPSSEETEPVVVLPTLPVEAPADVKEEVAVSVPTFFSPAAYPELSELIGVKYFMEDLLSLEYLKENVKVVAPLNYSDKEGNIRKGIELGLPFEYTWTCVARDDKACGVCQPCRDRLQAFAKVGVKDPAEYVMEGEENEV